MEEVEIALAVIAFGCAILVMATFVSVVRICCARARKTTDASFGRDGENSLEGPAIAYPSASVSLAGDGEPEVQSVGRPTPVGGSRW